MARHRKSTNWSISERMRPAVSIHHQFSASIAGSIRGVPGALGLDLRTAAVACARAMRETQGRGLCRCYYGTEWPLRAGLPASKAATIQIRLRMSGDGTRSTWIERQGSRAARSGRRIRSGDEEDHDASSASRESISTSLSSTTRTQADRCRGTTANGVLQSSNYFDRDRHQRSPRGIARAAFPGMATMKIGRSQRCRHDVSSSRPRAAINRPAITSST